jgi:hypothetical protein
MRSNPNWGSISTTDTTLELFWNNILTVYLNVSGYIPITAIAPKIHLTFPVKSENPCTPPEAGGNSDSCPGATTKGSNSHLAPRKFDVI